jgi:hypothetical protein
VSPHPLPLPDGEESYRRDLSHRRIRQIDISQPLGQLQRRLETIGQPCLDALAHRQQALRERQLTARVALALDVDPAGGEVHVAHLSIERG